MKGLAEAFTDFCKTDCWKSLKTDTTTKRFSLIERNAHGALSAYRQMYDEKEKPSKPPWTYF